VTGQKQPLNQRFFVAGKGEIFSEKIHAAQPKKSIKRAFCPTSAVKRDGAKGDLN